MLRGSVYGGWVPLDGVVVGWDKDGEGVDGGGWGWGCQCALGRTFLLQGSEGSVKGVWQSLWHCTHMLSVCIPEHTAAKVYSSIGQLLVYWTNSCTVA
jgi:hypothetical protein